MDPNTPPTPARKSLLRSGMVVSAMTMISRVLGFVRDVVMATVFGAGPIADAFFVAFKIPNFLRRLFAEGAFAQAFVPVFTECKEQQGPEALRDLVDHVAGSLGGILLLITGIGVSAAPLLILVFAPGFSDDGQRHALAAEMLRITFPYLLFISLTAFAGGILNSCGRFAVPAFTPVLLNLCLIAAALWLAPHLDQPIFALAWGVFFAGLAQLAFQIPFLLRLGLLPRPRWNWQHSGVRKILRLMAPALFGSSVAQLNLLLDTVIASFLAAGSVSWLYYSDRLMEFPLGVFGIAIATVVLPHLSARHSRAADTEFSHGLDWALRLALLIAVPAATGLLLLAGPLLTTLFQYGEFTHADTVMATWSLAAYALGLPGFILIKVLSTGFFSRQDMRTPVRIAVIALVANMLMNLALVIPMVMAGFAAPHAGLALATSASAWLQAGLLYLGLRRAGAYRPEPGRAAFATRLLVATLLLAGILLWFAGPTADWSAYAGGERLARLLGLIALATAVYLLTLIASGLRWRMLRGPDWN